jgi:protein TonB
LYKTVWYITDCTKPIIIEDPIFRVVKQMPFVKNNYEGTYAEKQQCGQKALLMFIYKNIKVPIIARENGIEGKTVIRFIIEKDGSISNIELIRNPGVGVGEKVIRVIKKMPPNSWEAGKHKDELVRV